MLQERSIQMMTRRSALADLFRAAGPAHHRAYQETDGFDPDWPIWYANYLQAGINELLGTSFTQSELVYWLVEMEHMHSKMAHPPAWPEFYADYLLANLGAW